MNPTKPATVEVLTFPKMCCGRPTQTRGGKPHCPVHTDPKLKLPNVAGWAGGW